LHGVMVFGGRRFGTVVRSNGFRWLVARFFAKKPQKWPFWSISAPLRRLKGWTKALYIETDKGSGWQFLAIDTVPHYIDTAPITAPATWLYRAMYLVNDERVGVWSDIKSITVG